MGTNRTRTFTRRLAVLAVALGCGGMPLSGCQTRFKEAVVAGSKDYLSVTLTSPDTAGMVLEGLGLTPDED